MRITLSIKIPAPLEHLVLMTLLLYRRLRFGFAFLRINLKGPHYTLVDYRDYKELSKYNWRIKKCKHTSYVVRTCREEGTTRQIYLHRAIMNFPKDLFIDHINRNGLDNRRANLRPATHKQNNWNTRRGFNQGSSKYKGVGWDKRAGKWRAILRSDGRYRNLGYFKNEIDAARAYDIAAKIHRGKFAALNFPD